MDKLFLDNYGGQTIQELIAMKDDYRIDSLVLAVEQALGSKSDSDLTQPERVVVTVEAMEREVNNGGYEGLFGNAPDFVAFLVHALELIDCPKTAALSTEAIALLELPTEFDSSTVEQANFDITDETREKLEDIGSRYYTNDENIEERLFAYIVEHQHEIRIPH